MRSALGEWKDIYEGDPLEPFVDNIMQITDNAQISIYNQREEVRRVVAAIFMQGKLSSDARWNQQMKENREDELNNHRI